MLGDPALGTNGCTHRHMDCWKSDFTELLIFWDDLWAQAQIPGSLFCPPRCRVRLEHHLAFDQWRCDSSQNSVKLLWDALGVRQFYFSHKLVFMRCFQHSWLCFFQIPKLSWSKIALKLLSSEWYEEKNVSFRPSKATTQEYSSLNFTRISLRFLTGKDLLAFDVWINVWLCLISILEYYFELHFRLRLSLSISRIDLKLKLMLRCGSIAVSFFPDGSAHHLQTTAVVQHEVEQATPGSHSRRQARLPVSEEATLRAQVPHDRGQA